MINNSTLPCRMKVRLQTHVRLQGKVHLRPLGVHHHHVSVRGVPGQLHPQGKHRS